MLSLIKGLFSGGTVKTIENIATELIETKRETAEANALMVKTLDPNGLMRRDISARVKDLYTLYIVVMLTLLILSAFEIGNVAQIDKAIKSMTDLFVPITTMFGTIVSASFGVNAMNSHKDK